MADTLTTDFSKLSPTNQRIISANAEAQGMTPQEYLDSRGGIYGAGYYGDTPDWRRLSDEEYAKYSALGGLKAGKAINEALNTKMLQAFTDNPDLIPDPMLRMAVKSGAITVADAIASINAGTYTGSGGRYGASGTGTSGTSSTEAANLEKERQNAFDLMSARFTELGLQALIPVMKQLIWDDVSEDTMWLRLQETDTFKQRFAANEARRKAGLRVLSVADYVAWEDTYRQVIRSYGLKQFDNDDYVKRFIANDISITELTNRVTIAAKRIRERPDIIGELKTFYGGILADSDILGYVLDPQNELSRIERMVTASEIGAAAQSQGLQVAGAKIADLERAAAEDLAAYGVTQEEARRGYGTIAEVLPGAEKLSEIYGGRLDKYGQQEAEQEVFKGTASAKRARERLVGTELAQFRGSSGLSRVAFASESQGQV